jgi:hypothetical protein
MEDDSIRKMVEITDAAVEAGRRLRESDPLSFKLAEQARKSIEVASQHSALRDLAYPYSAMLEFAQQDRLARERAIAFAQPLGSHDLLESMRKAEMMIPRLAIGPIAEMRDAVLFVTQQRVLKNSVAASLSVSRQASDFHHQSRRLGSSRSSIMVLQHRPCRSLPNRRRCWRR